MPSLSSEVVRRASKFCHGVYISIIKLIGFYEINFGISVPPSDYEFLQDRDCKCSIFKNPNTSTFNVYRREGPHYPKVRLLKLRVEAEFQILRMAES